MNVQVILASLILAGCASAERPSPSVPPVEVASAAGTGDPAPSSAEPADLQSVRVTGVALTVGDLDYAQRFFVDALGATVAGEPRALAGDEWAALIGEDGREATAVTLRLGEELIVLRDFTTEGARRRADATSDDGDFQHLALVTSDIDGVHSRVREHGAVAISDGGPQTIPESNPAAAGIRAFYFQDAERHPLELIWFPADKGEARWHDHNAPPRVLGVDHTAIAVADTERSLEFYVGLLHLAVAGESLNEGIEQERLSGVPDARVRITGLRASTGMGVELLDYLYPQSGRPPTSNAHAWDVGYVETTVMVDELPDRLSALTERGVSVSSRRVAACTDCPGEGTRAVIVRDPDGHAVRLSVP